MLRWVSAVALLAVSYLCEHPERIAASGLSARLRNRRLLEWILRNVYTAASGVYVVVHRREPANSVDRIAQYEWWQSTRDAEVLNRVSEVVHGIEELQNTPVAWEGDSEKLFLELRVAVTNRNDADWHDLGFQGKNPATDFRGAGRLGLLIFHQLCTADAGLTRQLLVESHSSTTEAGLRPWYPLALVSIRLSMALFELLKREKLLIVKLLGLDANADTDVSLVDWEDRLSGVHNTLITDFHASWLASVESGAVKTYFDNELVLKEFEATMPQRVYAALDAYATPRN